MSHDRLDGHGRTMSAGNGEAERLADIAAALRDYLTNETDVTNPSFHATAITSRILVGRFAIGGLRRGSR